MFLSKRKQIHGPERCIVLQLLSELKSFSDFCQFVLSLEVVYAMKKQTSFDFTRCLKRNEGWLKTFARSCPLGLTVRASLPVLVLDWPTGRPAMVWMVFLISDQCFVHRSSVHTFQHLKRTPENKTNDHQPAVPPPHTPPHLVFVFPGFHSSLLLFLACSSPRSSFLSSLTHLVYFPHTLPLALSSSLRLPSFIFLFVKSSLNIFSHSPPSSYTITPTLNDLQSINQLGFLIALSWVFLYFCHLILLLQAVAEMNEDSQRFNF